MYTNRDCCTFFVFVLFCFFVSFYSSHVIIADKYILHLKLLQLTWVGYPVSPTANDFPTTSVTRLFSLKY